MQVECTHCGSINTLEVPGEQTVVCGHCGRPFTAAGEPVLGRVSLKKMVVPVAYESDFGGLMDDLGPPPLGGMDALGPPPGGLDALGPPPVGLDAGGLGVLGDLGAEADFGGLLNDLDSMGAPPDGGYDLEALLGGGLPSDVAAPTAPLPPTQFQFGTSAEPAGLGGGPPSLADALGLPEQPDHRDGPTKLVDIDGGPVPGASTSGWKVRSERGLVYELMTIDAVVAWLEGKSDVSGVRVAEGDGEFQLVAEFPKLAKRLGLSEEKAFSFGGEDDGLSLALDRKPETKQAPNRKKTAGAVDPLTHQKQREAAASGDKKRRPTPPRAQRPLSFTAVLGVLLGACILVGGLVIGGSMAGIIDRTPTASRPVPVLPPPSEKLEQAIELYDGGQYSSAANALERLARREDDPRIHRYLALAYHRTNRKQMARTALAEYRRGMHRVSREHGRQVRKVRD